MPQAMKNTRRKSSSGQRKENFDKIPAWQLTKVRNKKEVIDEARKEGKTVRFASLMDICRLKNSELEPKVKQYNGRVVCRGDIVKGWFRLLRRLSQSKVHRHQKWWLQKSWILYQDYQDAQDKQEAQYLLIPRSKWKMHLHCCLPTVLQ